MSTEGVLAVVGAVGAGAAGVWSAMVSPLLLLPIVIFAVYTYLRKRLFFVGKDEQLFVETLTDMEVHNGPQVFLVPFLVRGIKKRKAISLSTVEYCLIKNSLSGVSRVEKGPQLLFLKPYDEFDGIKKAVIALKKTEYVRFVNKATGQVRVVHGEKGGVVPEPNESFLDSCGKKNAIDLKCYEFTKIEDKKTGAVRIERGEKLVFLSEFEETVGTVKQRAVEVDEETAVLVRNKRTGQQSLIEEKQLFFPKWDEEILEVRKLIKLADYEACIVRGKDGKDVFYFGSNQESQKRLTRGSSATHVVPSTSQAEKSKEGGQRSFFLPPYSSLVKLLWSRGRRRERRDLEITKIDLRPMYMSFEFNCRTADNVELVLEGSFFWEVVDLKAMVQFTNDTTGDICNHARSKFIEAVSKVTLQTFMSDFNTIAKKVLSDKNADEDTFYSQRGCTIHSLEVTGYHCAEKKTADILGAIIQETTNRMNRLQKQESENEVQLFRIKGDIEEERAKGELLEIQTQNHNARASMEGLGEAERVKAFLTGLSDELPDMNARLNAWNVLRKRDALDVVSKGNAKLFFTPKDANISIEQHDHDHVGFQGSEQAASESENSFADIDLTSKRNQ